MTSRVYDRVPMPRDEHDWRAVDFLGARALSAVPDPLAAVDAALAALNARAYISKYHKDLANAVVAYLHGTKPAPAPVPTPRPVVPPVSQRWADLLQLDQKDTGHCVGFGWAQRFNHAEAVDHDAASFPGFTDVDAHAIYYECKKIDGNVGGIEGGSDTRSGAKAMKARGLLTNYAFATTTDEITAWLLTKGPVVVGTDWYEGMENPDTRGLIRVTGAVLGGHEYLLDGFDASPPTPGAEYIGQNSWGASWGDHGYFRIKVTDFAHLLATGGDACVVVES